MSLKSVLLLLIVVLIVTCGCDNSPAPDIDQIWEVRYFVNNLSEQELVVEASGPAARSEGMIEVAVAAGEISPLYDYSEFLGPEPDAGRMFWCISVRRPSDGALVYQLCPVENSQWSWREVGRFEHEYTLELNSADIGPTVDSCPIIVGTVTDLGTGDPIAGATVACDCGLKMVTHSNEVGEYSLRMPYGIPESNVYFWADGYREQVFETRHSLIHVGGNVFTLDVQMELGVE